MASKQFNAIDGYTVGNSTIISVIDANGNVSGNVITATANITAPQLISNIATGTAPFVVTSTTQVANLSVATAGTATSATTAGTVTTAAQPNITSVGTLSTATITTGNITTINSGLLQNGNSNVTITANGNVTLNAVGGARITATSTGANVTGTLGVSGNLTAGNLIGPHANGNSNVNMPAANGNINMSVAGNANVLVVTGTGVFATPRSGPGLTVYAVSGTHSTTIADSGNTTYSAGYLEIPQSGAAAKTANYTAVLADSGKSIIMNGSNLFATIPANASVAFNIGTTLTFININASNLTLSITTDTLRLAGSSSTGNRILIQYGLATAVKVTTTSWIVGGTGLT